MSLSGFITPSKNDTPKKIDDRGVLSDVYVAVVTPDGSIWSLDGNLAWKDTIPPILKDFSLSEVSATNFYSLVLP